MLIKWEKPFRLIQCNLLLNWRAHQEYVSRLQILTERVYRNYLAGSNNQGPVFCNLFKLFIS